MSTFTVTVPFSADAAEAVARVTERLVDGFDLTGRTHDLGRMRHAVEVVDRGGDRNDCWVMLTSYGMDPSDKLGSVWQTVPGVGAFE